jgi:Amidase
VLLCPAGPGVAPPLNHARYWGYTAQWNLLDYPALVFPVGVVDQGRDAVDGGYQPVSEMDRWNYELCQSLLSLPSLPPLPFFPTRPCLARQLSVSLMFFVRGHLIVWLADDLSMEGADSPEKYVDAPVSLQLVGRRFDDEKVRIHPSLYIYIDIYIYIDDILQPLNPNSCIIEHRCIYYEVIEITDADARTVETDRSSRLWSL